MPEELIIILAIAIGAIWLIVKICQTIVGAIGRAAKNHYAAAEKKKKELLATDERRRKELFVEGKNDLLQFVRSLIPNELDRFEKELEVARTKFNEAQKATNWIARRPAWEKEDFQPLARPLKNSLYGQMYIDDLEAMLRPDSNFSTWSAEESEIINRRCEYPSAPPATKPDKFTPFTTLNSNLQLATFAVDTAHITDKDAIQYFSDEQGKVLEYNNRRAALLARAASLNSAIEEWNRNSRISWEIYVAESQQLEHAALAAFQQASEVYTKACKEERGHFKRLLEGYKKGEKQSVLERLDYVVDKVKFPDSVPHVWEIDFDEEQRIVVLEVGLPDVVHQDALKKAILKSGPVEKPLNQKEGREFAPKVHPAILLRTAYEVFRNDTAAIISLLVVNGWVTFDDPATGINTKAYTASILVTREQINNLNLSKIDPLAAFDSLHGKSAGKLIEIIPIEPMLSLNRKDSRFVPPKEVLKDLGTETNLAAMDWQDFEHLIRELFEKEFSGRGAEVKITQASRDRGVDAIVFDPDPIRGGKYVIQAKRYTNTVDVSSVRDLCAVVKKERASRGILVTTSTYGADAYAFANNEPITLLTGAELLGLLKKHGYSFRIDLQEARRSV